jgi:hypothetical protein
MAYHNDLLGEKIPLSTLLQAVQKSTGTILLHDLEWLRERCGCLVVVEQEAFRNVERTVVSLHIVPSKSTCGLLESSRRFPFFALAQEAIRKQFSEIALHQVLDIQPGSVTEYKIDMHREAHFHLVDANFRLYSGVFSAGGLNQ